MWGYDFYLFSIRLGENITGSTVGNYPLNEGENDIESIYKVFDNGGWGPWAKFYRNTIIHQYNIKFRVGQKVREDNLFNLNYWSHIQRFYYYKQPAYFYRTNPYSVVHKPSLAQIDDYFYMTEFICKL